MKKKLENFWYYYKYYVLIGVVFLIGFLIAVKSCANKPDYDISALYITHSYVDIDGKMEPLMSKYAKDVNGDGKTNLQIIPISYGTSHKEAQSAGATRAAQLATGEFVLLVLDEQNYTELKEHGFLMDISHLGESSKLNGDYFDVTEFLYNIEGFKRTEEKFYLCIRSYDKAKAKEQKNYDKRYEIAYDYIKKLCEDYK